MYFSFNNFSLQQFVLHPVRRSHIEILIAIYSLYKNKPRSWMTQIN